MEQKLAIGEEITLVNINGRIYRKAPVKFDFQKASTHAKFNQEASEMEYFQIDESCEIQDQNLNIESDEATSTFTLKLEISPVYWNFLIGEQNSKKNEIQKKSGATLIIPSKDSKDEVIIIKANSKQSIILAKKEIDLIINDEARKIPFTHFIAIPLQEKNFVNKYMAFKDQVLKNHFKSKGFSDSLFILENRLHLTLFTLKLYSQKEKEKAVQILESSQAKLYELAETRTVNFRIKGVESMNHNPSKVNVLYAVPIDTARLSKICDFLVQSFKDAKLIPSNYKIKFHVTLMNTKHRIDSKSTKGNEGESERIPFDGTSILKQFKNFDFGECFAKQIQLLELGTSDVTGYWKIEKQILLP